MTRGCLIFAHNSKDIDYALMSIIAGSLAKKYLKVPVSLVTDTATIDWLKQSQQYSKAESVFDKIIEIKEIDYNNSRRLHDGTDSSLVPFLNGTRSLAYDLTPYDRTLLLDSDFLIFSDRLNSYWDYDESVLISTAMNDICDPSRQGYQDRYISDTGIKLYWATTVMFSKDEYGKAFFNLVNYIKENYKTYSDLYGFFEYKRYRNDISFSIAKHIMDGFMTSNDASLPPILTTMDRDILYKNVKEKLIFLVTPTLDEKYCAVSTLGIDIHIMNKQSIIRNADELMEVANG